MCSVERGHAFFVMRRKEKLDYKTRLTIRIKEGVTISRQSAANTIKQYIKFYNQQD